MQPMLSGDDDDEEGDDCGNVSKYNLIKKKTKVINFTIRAIDKLLVLTARCTVCFCNYCNCQYPHKKNNSAKSTHIKAMSAYENYTSLPSLFISDLTDLCWGGLPVNAMFVIIIHFL